MRSPEELNDINANVIEEKKKTDMKSISFEEFEIVIKKWMLVSDPHIILFVMSCYIAIYFPTKAIFAAIIAPSGGGKSEFLAMLKKLPKIYELSTITPNTFLSGMPGKGDASLLPKITGNLMVMKDFTSIISMKWETRSEILGQFREIWDGFMRKVFGNGKERTWEGKLPILVATTEAFDQLQQQNTMLGERFLSYRLGQPDRIEVGRRSMKNHDHAEQMQEEMQDATFAFIKGIDTETLSTGTTIELSEEDKNEIVYLADFTTRARSGIIRDNNMKRDVIFVPQVEMPPRLIGQLMDLLKAAAVCHGGMVTKACKKMIYKVAFDSIPQTNRMVINELAKQDNQSTAEIATELGYPTDPIRMYLENMTMLRICDRIKGKDSEERGNEDRWTIRSSYAEIYRRYHEIETKDPAVSMGDKKDEEFDKF